MFKSTHFFIVCSILCTTVLGFSQQKNSEPWTPPSDNSAAPAAVQLDPSKLPDILGVHLGMDPQQALALVRARYPRQQLSMFNNTLSVFPSNVFLGTVVNPAAVGDDDFSFINTLPPDKQAVWQVWRATKRMHVNRDTLLAALRQKYGKETVAFSYSYEHAANNDNEIATMYWLFNESGKRIAIPDSNPATVYRCWADFPNSPTGYLLNEARGQSFAPAGWCATSFVAVRVTIPPKAAIVENMLTEMVDLPLARRSSHSTAVWYRAAAAKARQRDIEKSRQNKPVM